MIFCHKCGAKADDDAIICGNCGERLILDDTEQQAVATIQNQVNNVQTDIPQPQINSNQANVPQPQKKKSHKLPIILGMVAFVVVAFIVAIGLSGDKINYIATVKAHKPLASTTELSYTYEEVFNKYVKSPVWELRKVENDTAYVDMSGSIKDVDNTYSNLALTFTVSPNPNNPNGALIHLLSGTLDGKSATSEKHLQTLVTAMFLAYSKNSSDFISEVSAAAEIIGIN